MVTGEARLELELLLELWPEALVEPVWEPVALGLDQWETLRVPVAGVLDQVAM